MRSLDCSRDVPIAENTRQSADEETYDAVVLVPRVFHSAGYNLFNLMRASAVVNCQSALA
jgi:hypothetical protein